MADQMAAYFYSETHELGNAYYYNEKLTTFSLTRAPRTATICRPRTCAMAASWPCWIGPDCNSACEFFSYDLTVGNRAAIVGQHPTAGLGGSIDVHHAGERALPIYGRALGGYEWPDPH
ncbi:MAG: hypothetical protein R2911_02990 [Caldilineaceae bacterium]